MQSDENAAFQRLFIYFAEVVQIDRQIDGLGQVAGAAAYIGRPRQTLSSLPLYFHP